MKKNKKFLIIILIVITILGTFLLIFNNNDKITKNSSQIKGNIEISNSSNERFIGQMTLSTEKTEEAMENNSNVLQKAIDDVSNAGGGTITLPAGTYYFAPTGTYIEKLESGATEKKSYYAIECRSNVKLVGAGTDESNSSSCTILKPYGSNLDVSLTMFQYINQDQPKVYIENADFADFIVDANETSKDPNSGYAYVAQGKGFSFSAFKYCDWNNVVVKNTDGTGFGMDLPINCTVTNCVAIGCGKAATENDVGASGFGIGTGYSEDESMKISNCTAIGNRKFGFFFEHQGRFVSYINARTAKGFIVTDCVARGNMYNFGGEKSNDVVYLNCISENSHSDDPNPLENQNTNAYYFGTNSRRDYVEDCSVEQKFSNITDESEFYYNSVNWAADNSIISSGVAIPEYDALGECDKAEAIVMLWRFAGRPGEVLLRGETVNTGYDDVPTNEWYSDAVAWAYGEGILGGGEAYNPSSGCNRGDFITMLWRYAGKPIVSTGNDYTDVNEEDFFYNAVNWAVSKGIVIPQSSEFNPATPYTRAEILTLLYRYDSLNPQRVVVYDYWENGGNDVDKVYDIKHKGDKVDLNKEARKTGYEFIGWSTNENATTGTSSINMNEDNIYLYALYRKDIEITYDGNGGNNTPSNQSGTMYNKEVNTDIRLSNTIPEKDGYTFKGWTDEEDSQDVKYVPGQTYSFSDSCTLYAVWEENTDVNTYTLTVKPNGGTWNNSTQDVEINGDSGTTVDISNPIPPEGSTVTFDGNGGTAEKTSETSEKTFNNWTLSGAGSLNGTTYTFGDGLATITANYKDGGIEMPNATRNGFVLRGWTDVRGSTQVRYRAGEKYTFDNDCTLYAVWGQEGEEEETYQVTYDYSYNGGESSDKIQEEKLPGEKIDLDVKARKTGYEFVGWSTDKNAKEGLESLVMGNDEITLYAIFKKDISINFIDYKGTEENQTEENITIYNNDKGEITAPEINQYSDWTSRYWTSDKQPDSEQTVESGGVITNITENQTYFARYTKEISISFDLNEGEGTLPETINGNIEVNSNNINNVKGFEVTIPDAEISRDGFRFSGWMTNKDETGTDYEIGDEVSFTSDVVLYAKWIKNGDSTVDGDLPVLILEYNKDKWTNQDIELLITAEDEESGIDRVTVNGEIVLESDGSTSYIISENGTYDIVVTDKEGNSLKRSITISNIDKVLPIIDRIELEGNKVKITSIDNESGTNRIEYSYDGETWYDLLDESIDKEFIVKNYVYKSGESYATLELNNEIYTMYFRAIDEAGNVGEAKSTELNYGNDNPFDDNNDNTTSNNNSNNSSSNNINSSNTQKGENNNAGLANKWLPYAGKNTIIILIIIISIVAIIFRKKYNDLKDVK